MGKNNNRVIPAIFCRGSEIELWKKNSLSVHFLIPNKIAVYRSHENNKTNQMHIRCVGIQRSKKSTRELLPEFHRISLQRNDQEQL